MPPGTAYHLIHDELIFDGSSRFNLATFCSTWMDDEAPRLMSETFDTNMIDKDEYPQTNELEMRCVHMLADLWHAPDPANALGTSTIGSSEACMLGGLALKWRWREKMKKLGKPVDRPNLVLGTNTQVCWHKFLRYWDVEERPVALDGNQSVTDPERAAAACDENTIGVVSVLGSTFTATTRCKRVERGTGPVAVAAANGPGHSHSRRRRERRFRGALHSARRAVGFSIAAREIHQHIGAQVWVGLSRRGLDRVARNVGFAPGSDLQRGLPGHQLLAHGQPDSSVVLQPDPAGSVGISRHSPGVSGRGRQPCRTDRRYGSI
jgi:hypothetical protein